MAASQTEGLGTARALLDAGNIDGAKRILGQLLEKRPDDTLAAKLMIQAHMKQGNAKEALTLCDNWIAQHPNAVGIHVDRFEALAKLGKKKEMASTLKQFEQTFPHHKDAISTMKLYLDAKKGKTNSVRKQIEQELGDVKSPALIRAKALALHQLNDLFEADHYLALAIEHYPTDSKLLAAMAVNRFQLGRLASSRNFAARALALDPTKRPMLLLSRLTWMFYYPGFYLMLIAISAGLFFFARMNKIVGFIAFIVLFFLVKGVVNLSFMPIIILLGIVFSRATSILTLLAIIGYLVAVAQKDLQSFSGRKKTVKLKKY